MRLGGIRRNTGIRSLELIRCEEHSQERLYKEE